ncbi:efflux RND transporter periplasmic adaptor subunit [Oleidesulfovibrio sp.]|uniref:efflux RND transporter periplasmic adaptor subunit n=1 Tax=Oleidesulfovibrio sp. TaxID=2909707 RepID=UPI003A8C0FF4
MPKRKLLAVIGGVTVLIFLFLWSSGMLNTQKLSPEDTYNSPSSAATTQQHPATTAKIVAVKDTIEAVGTVRPRTETRVEAQVTAKILHIAVSTGDKVRKGDILIELDNRELVSRRDQAAQAIIGSNAAVAQARQAVAEAKAAFAKAKNQYQRIKALFSERAVAQRELDQAEAEYLQSEAALASAQGGLSGALSAGVQASKRLEEAEIALGYATITALEDGEVVRREAEAGDLAFPGKPLLVIQAGGALRLEAQVREGLIQRVRTGSGLQVRIAAAGESPLAGVVEEVVPSADPRTRTFLVKVGLPPAPGLYPGMYGKLLIPLDARQTVLIPAVAVQRVGQLETVRIHTADNTVQTVHVKTGRHFGNDIEILSGLTGGEQVLLPVPAPPARTDEEPEPAPVPDSTTGNEGTGNATS